MSFPKAKKLASNSLRSHACSLVTPLSRCLGAAFLFAEIDYIAQLPNFLYDPFKVKDLVEASTSVAVLPVMIDQTTLDQIVCARPGSLYVLPPPAAATSCFMGNSLKDPALEAYSVFTSYHGFVIRKDVTAGLFDALPTKAELINRFNEDGEFYVPAHLLLC
ncbi:hypothetical protein SASPL_116840 [Salvia splendens]|uniref:Uncharacterized protein n=1 Tax=Salvia splendens TaxID=180675 RepID=A0A8X8XZF7_SALSN|nr:hypothetical protein SASPL_116840 [Salvia splendens]